MKLRLEPWLGSPACSTGGGHLGALARSCRSWHTRPIASPYRQITDTGLKNLRRILVKPERGLILGLWLRSPMEIGAVAASGGPLARAMARRINLARPGLIVELGGGTGSITEALLARGVPAERLVIVERHPKLHRLLERRFPHATVICGDAVDLRGLLAGRGLYGGVNAIVSGLPLLAMSEQQQRAIVAEAAAAMGPHGRLVQFSYGPLCPVPDRLRAELGVRGRVVATVLINLPPARVWVFFASRPSRPPIIAPSTAH